MRKADFLQMSQLVDMTNLHAIFEEIKNIFIRHYSVESFHPVRSLFKRLNKFISDHKQPGDSVLDYSQAAQIALAFIRIVDGYNIQEKKKLNKESVILGLMASLLSVHGLYSFLDVPEKNLDISIKEGMRKVVDGIVDRYKLTEEEFSRLRQFSSCSGIDFLPGQDDFKEPENKTIGMMLASADILGRMSSRNYLEKLVWYYDGITQNADEEKRKLILKQNIEHYREVIMIRLEEEFQGLFKLCELHFSERYDIGYNMYIEAIDRQIEFLEDIIAEEGADSLHKSLKRRI